MVHGTKNSVGDYNHTYFEKCPKSFTKPRAQRIIFKILELHLFPKHFFDLQLLKNQILVFCSIFVSNVIREFVESFHKL